jgi:hypothetical protein
MRSGSARRFVVLWWLLVALLPLRAWAGVVMHLPGVAGVQAHADAAPPCHAHADGLATPADAAAERLAGAPHDADGVACTLCDLCHGSAAVIAAPVFDPATGPAQALPSAVPSPAPQVDPTPLYRPPRG